MEAQIGWRVMANMFDERSLVLASLVVLNTVRHSGMSKHELRLHDVTFKAGHAVN